MKILKDALRSRFVRHSAWMTASSVANLVSGMVFVWLFGRSAGAAVLGLMTLAQRVGDFASTVLDLRIDEAVTRAVIDYGQKQRPGKALSAVLLAYAFDLALGLVAFALIWFVVAPWSAGYYAEPQLTMLVRIYAVALLVGTVNSTGVGVLQAFEAFEPLAILFSISALLELVFPLVAWWGGWGLEGVMASFVLYHLCYNAGLTFLAFKLMRARYAGVRPEAWGETGRELFRMGGLVTLSGTLKTLFRSLDVLILGRFASQAQLGCYRVAKSYGGMVGFFAGPVGTVLYPKLTALASAGDWRMFHAANLRIMKWMAASSVPMGLGAVLLAPWVLAITVKRDFDPALPAILWIVLASLLTNITAWLKPAIVAIGKPELSVWSNVVTAGVLAGACLALAPATAHVGAAQAWFLAHLAGVGIGVWLLRGAVPRYHPAP